MIDKWKIAGYLFSFFYFSTFIIFLAVILGQESNYNISTWELGSAGPSVSQAIRHGLKWMTFIGIYIFIPLFLIPLIPDEKVEEKNET